MNILKWYLKIILEYGKHLQECTGNLAIKFAFFLFLIITNQAMTLLPGLVKNKHLTYVEAL